MVQRGHENDGTRAGRVVLDSHDKAFSPALVVRKINKIDVTNLICIYNLPRYRLSTSVSMLYMTISSIVCLVLDTSILERKRPLRDGGGESNVTSHDQAHKQRQWKFLVSFDVPLLRSLLLEATVHTLHI